MKTPEERLQRLEQVTYHQSEALRLVIDNLKNDELSQTFRENYTDQYTH